MKLPRFLVLSFFATAFYAAEPTRPNVLLLCVDDLKPLLKYLASELAAIAERLDDPAAVTKLFDEANRAKSLLK